MQNFLAPGDLVRVKNRARPGYFGDVNRARSKGQPVFVNGLTGVALEDAAIDEEFDMQLVGVIELELEFTTARFPGDAITINIDTDEVDTDNLGMPLGRLLDHVPAAGTHKVRVRFQTM